MIAKQAGADGFRWHCPGCDLSHVVPVAPLGALNGWEWNGSWDAPTLSPSVLVGGVKPPPPGPGVDPEFVGWPTCHSFVRDGLIVFLDDCEHELAGQTVPMVDIPTIHR